MSIAHFLQCRQFFLKRLLFRFPLEHSNHVSSGLALDQSNTTELFAMKWLDLLCNRSFSTQASIKLNNLWNLSQKEQIAWKELRNICKLLALFRHPLNLRATQSEIILCSWSTCSTSTPLFWHKNVTHYFIDKI